MASRAHAGAVAGDIDLFDPSLDLSGSDSDGGGGGPRDRVDISVQARRMHRERDGKAFPKFRPPHAGGAYPLPQWKCTSCTMLNERQLMECSVCSAPRPPADAAVASSFTCSTCTYVNVDAEASACEMCGTKRPAAGGSPAKNNNNNNAGGHAESKDDDESRRFVLGSSPPPFKRRLMIREHNAFLAGVEESFGTIHVHANVLRGVENLVRKQWETLERSFERPSSAAVVAASPLHASPAKANAGGVAPVYTVITPDILAHLLKALVHRACAQAIQVHRTMETILAASACEEKELQGMECNTCHQSGEDVMLQYSEGCKAGDGGASLKHTFCMSCSHHRIMSLVHTKQCQRIECPYPGCGCELDTKFIRRCLSTSEFKLYLDECFAALIAGPVADPASGGASSNGKASFLHCPNPACSTIMEVLEPHGLVVPILIKEVDENGKQLTPEAWIHFSSHRVRCHACHVNFCSSCKAQPYHLGRSCAQHREYAEAKHCRFCADQLTKGNIDVANQIKAFDLVCTADACQEKKRTACPECLPGCGHPCAGVVGEPYHPPCLVEECAKKNEQLKVSGGDLCAICWVDELQSAPVVQLTSCSHLFHAHCVVDKISKRWPGVRITFGFLDCSLCKQPMSHPAPSIQTVRAPIDQLWKSIAEKSIARLSIEKMEKDVKLTDPQSRYYNQPLKYAMDCFAYYTCHKCNNFYFGGRRDCEANAAAENRPPEEFVCFNCADLKSVLCKNADHSEYQVWKCRFCCNLASWFCFGTTHFCEKCHSDAPMDRVKRPRSAFKQCTGYQTCPLKLPKHAPNGPEAECEFNVGCGACQEEVSKLQAAREKEKAIDQKVKDLSVSSVRL
jgi:hypothetical protein